MLPFWISVCGKTGSGPIVDEHGDEVYSMEAAITIAYAQYPEEKWSIYNDRERYSND